MTTIVQNQTDLKASAGSINPDLLEKLRRSVGDPKNQDQIGTARAVAFTATAAYWETVCSGRGGTAEWSLRPLKPDARISDIPSDARVLAAKLGTCCGGLDVAVASHMIGSVYTMMMPNDERSGLGAYYTPPSLCQRLIDLASEAGVNWNAVRVLDPACGAGAFLLPAAQRIMDHAASHDAEVVLQAVEQRLSGLDVDPFACWLSQVFLDALTIDYCADAVRRLEPLVTTGDALELEPDGTGFDLVIGNPPYGRTKLRDDLRGKFARSLYGHANLYGVFTDLAVRLAHPTGIVAYVTPTSFLSGEYFKSLRSMLGTEAPPVSIEFVTDRKGVFDDVLQETVLTVYRRGRQPQPSRVSFTSMRSDRSIETAAAGKFELPDDPQQPWMVPRSSDLGELLERVSAMPHRLTDYGYEVKTGPLVWNRHKEDLRRRRGKGCFPLIWAEAVRPDGVFDFRAKKPPHQPYFRPKPHQGWLIIRTPCVLLQRTTSKEQQRRLIAAELPAEFVADHDGVVVENHLNVVRPRKGETKISPAALAAVLNSDIVDRIFRCINGSVAVSAYELQALPLPHPDSLGQLEQVIAEQASRDAVERTVELLYRATVP